MLRSTPGKSTDQGAVADDAKCVQSGEVRDEVESRALPKSHGRRDKQCKEGGREMSHPTTRKCWICGQSAGWVPKETMDGHYYSCIRCGMYSLSREVQRVRVENENALRPYLAAFVRRSMEEGLIVVPIPLDWPSRVEGFANSTIQQRVRRLLEWLGKKTRFGEEQEFVFDYVVPWAAARDEDEVRFLFEYLFDLNYLDIYTPGVNQDPESVPIPVDGGANVRLSVAGWEALSPVAGTGVAGTCFVAMAFAPELAEAFDQGIAPAIEECGFTVRRLDREQHNEEITDRMVAAIRASEFMVADLTGHRPNVYYEAGFAEALGRVVIKTCRSDQSGDVAFDVRQRPIIRWTQPADLKQQLVDRIRGTVQLPARLG